MANIDKPTTPLNAHKNKVERQKEFALKETKKGNSGNFWNSLREEFEDARREEDKWRS